MRGLRRLWALLTRRRVESDLDDELRFHLDMETANNVARGMSSGDAAMVARRALGGIERTKDDVREARGLDRIDALMRDIRFAMRSLRRAPAVLLAVTLTLGLSIGATTAIFSVVHVVLLEPLPYREPSRLVEVQSMNRGSSTRWNVTYRDYLTWQEDRVFAHVALFRLPELDLSAGEEPLRIRLAVVTREFFEVLQVQPILGRLPTPDEFSPGSDRPLVISYGVWQRLGGRRDIVNSQVRMTGVTVTIVGVLPRGAGWPQNADAWYPNRGRVDESTLAADNYDNWSIARLKDGGTIEQARLRLDALARRMEASFPAKRRGVTVTAVPLREYLVGATLARALWLLLGAIAFVLAIACANIANLQLARAMARQREMALRVALGASRGRLLRQLVVESLLLALPGGALGLAVAFATLRAIVALAPSDLPQLGRIGLHPIALGASAATTVAIALLVGLLPALQASRAAPADALAEGERGSTGARSRRLASGLVIAEVALSLALLAGAGLLVESLSRLMRVNTGLDDARVLTFEAALPQATFQTNAVILRAWSDLTRTFAAEPGIRAVSVASALPLGGGGFYLGRTMLAEGAPRPPDGPEVSIMWNAVAPGYFDVLGQPLLEGRDFTPQDDSASTPVVIVTRAFVKALFPDGRAVGRRVVSWRDENVPREIVGVVGDVRYEGASDTAKPIVYVPLGQQVFRDAVVMLRTTGDPQAAGPLARRVLRNRLPGVALARVRTMPEVMRASTARLRFNVRLLTAFAGLALVLAAIGLYGLLAYDVAQRRLEIGVRMALGARRGAVVRMVLGRALRLATAGAAIGLLASLGLAQLLRSQLFEVSPADPATLATVTGTLLLVALLAATIPARRATCIDPATALRAQ